MDERLRIAVVGAGYWGPNLARNFSSSPDWELVAICDLDRDRAQKLADRVGRIDVETDLDTLLAETTWMRSPSPPPRAPTTPW